MAIRQNILANAAAPHARGWSLPHPGHRGGPEGCPARAGRSAKPGGSIVMVWKEPWRTFGPIG